METQEFGPWPSKYRPRTLQDYIGHEDVKRKMQEYIDNNDLPHLLFHSRPGTGKSALAKILMDQVDCESLYINASNDRGIETVREKVMDFVPLAVHDLKVVVLDECLDEDTLVTVLRDGEDEKVPIKDVDPENDLVKSYNVEKGAVQYRPFDLLDQGERDVYDVELANGQVITCTSDHKWYVRDGGEVKVVTTQRIVDGDFSHVLSPQ